MRVKNKPYEADNALDWSRKLRQWVNVRCPNCDFSCGGFYKRDITPTRPMTFECKRDRVWDENDKQMYQAAPCGAKWDIAVTEKDYEEWLFVIAKQLVLTTLLLSIVDSEEETDAT